MVALTACEMVDWSVDTLAVETADSWVAAMVDVLAEMKVP
jgi:hypothetical protein